MKPKKLLSLILAASLLIGGNVFATSAASDLTSDDFTKEELEMNGYDLYKYTLPYWEGNIVYNECVYPVTSGTDTPKAYKLMYDATEIISVRNYIMSVTYEEGRDYYLEDGMLYINPTGNIPTVEHDYIHPTENPKGYDWTVFYPTRDGSGYEYWNEGTELARGTLVVSYIHNDTWDHPVPQSVEESLPKTMEKLMGKEELTIVVNGDSVSAGALASGSQGLYPFADAYPEMTAKALAEKFGNDKIKLVNTAIGGTMANYTSSLLEDTVIKHSPDLVIINYGMNDSSCDRVGVPKAEFKENVIGRIEYIRERLPDCEFLLVSSLYGNIYTFPRERYEEHAAAYSEIAAEYEGVAFCDPQAIMGSVIDSGKDYICFMADNMVHPNDYGMRLTTQAILAALDVSDIDGYKKSLIDRYAAYASPDDHEEDGKKAELLGVIADAEAAIADLDEEWLINEALEGVYEKIDAILRRCAFEDHVFTDTVTTVTCKTDGYTHSECSVCGYEYEHDRITAPGVEHIMDSGRQTSSPNYKKGGTYTYTCVTCGYEETEEIPMLTGAPTLSGESMLHVAKGNNYMQTNDVLPYTNGTGTVEIDVCPIDIAVDGTAYIGVWFAGYALCAAYNFREQRVEIVETSLPYSSAGNVYASAPYEWTPDSGEYGYNWKRFTFQIKGNNVKIYIDGELILDSTNSLYRASSEVALPYSIGEFYLDNFKIVKGDYDPVSGTGGTSTYLWDLNTASSRSSFNSEWGFGGHTTVTTVNATSATLSSAKYTTHVHDHSYVTTVKPTCSLQGYREYLCSSCGETEFLSYIDATCDAGHTLREIGYSKQPTATEDGLFVYGCETCDGRFTRIVPAGTATPAVAGDANGDGSFDTADLMVLLRHLAGLSTEMNEVAADVNSDGIVDTADVMAIKRKLAGLSA